MKNNEARRSAFVLRVWQDEDGRTWGQIQEPVSGWQRPFNGINDLWLALLERLHPASDNDDGNRPFPPAE
jgi:hypothetical protein